MTSPRTVALAFRLDQLDHLTRQVLLGIYRHADRAGWRCILDPLALDALPGPYQGLIAPGSSLVPERAGPAGVPYVCVTPEAESSHLTRVIAHHRRAGTLAARHLLDCGYRHFAYVGFHTDAASSLLERGFRAGLSRPGRGASYLLLSTRFLSSPGRLARNLGGLGEWLDERPRPVGILAASDLLARQLAGLALRKGIRVPDDVGLVGTGDDPALCLAPPLHLTSLDLAPETVGARAAALLDKLMDGASPPRANRYVEPSLVTRRSTDRDWRQDATVSEALGYIAGHCRDRLRISEVAEAVGLGPRQLLRRFLDSRGRTVADEIALARLRLARDLLQTSDLPDVAIAQAVGYHTAVDLRRAFARHEGTTPSAVRGAGREE